MTLHARAICASRRRPSLPHTGTAASNQSSRPDPRIPASHAWHTPFVTMRALAPRSTPQLGTFQSPQRPCIYLVHASCTLFRSLSGSGLMLAPPPPATVLGPVSWVGLSLDCEHLHFAALPKLFVASVRFSISHPLRTISHLSVLAHPFMQPSGLPLLHIATALDPPVSLSPS